MKYLGHLFALALVLCVFFSACSEKPKVRVPVAVMGLKPPSAFHSTECDKSLWSHVYNPGRLEVKDDCVSVTGTVESVTGLDDGNYQIQLALDSGYEALLNQANHEKQDDLLVVEVICQRKNDKEECKNYNRVLNIPKRGARVRVAGTYVVDHTANRDWASIHPATSITPAP